MFDGTRKRFQPIIVVGDTLRRVKRATDDYVGSGTYKWGVLQGGAVCAGAGYILYSRSGRKPYTRAASLFVFDHVCLCEQVRANVHGSRRRIAVAHNCEPLEQNKLHIYQPYHSHSGESRAALAFSHPPSTRLVVLRT